MLGQKSAWNCERVGKTCSAAMCWTAISEINIAQTIRLSHTSMPGFPVEDTAVFPGDGKRRVMTSSAWPTGTGVFFWLVFRCSFFSSLFIYFILEQGEMGRRSMADRKRYSVTVNKTHASLLYWRCINLKEKDVASSSLHQRSFYSKTQNNMKSATTGVFKLWCQWYL